MNQRAAAGWWSDDGLSVTASPPAGDCGGREGHQNHRPIRAINDGSRKLRTTSVSSSRPMPTVEPSWVMLVTVQAAHTDDEKKFSQAFGMDLKTFALYGYDGEVTLGNARPAYNTTTEFAGCNRIAINDLLSHWTPECWKCCTDFALRLVRTSVRAGGLNTLQLKVIQCRQPVLVTGVSEYHSQWLRHIGWSGLAPIRRTSRTSPTSVLWRREEDYEYGSEDSTQRTSGRGGAHRRAGHDHQPRPARGGAVTSSSDTADVRAASKPLGAEYI
jgi:hypothetical protein